MPRLVEGALGGSGRALVVVADVGEELHAGDEAILLASLEQLRQRLPELACTLVAASTPGLAERLGVERAMAPGEPSARLAAEIEEAIRAADGLLVCGGGNLCSSWPELLWLRVALMREAHRLRKPVLLGGQTLGPHLTAREREALAGTLGPAAHLGVRDLPSLALAAGLGVEAGRMGYQADDALFLRGEAPPEGVLPFAADEPFVAVTFDAGFALQQEREFLRSMADQLIEIAGISQSRLVFVPHVGRAGKVGQSGDGEVGVTMRRWLRARHLELEVLPVLPPRQVAWLTQRAVAVVSSRYHPIVFATAAGVPAIAIHRDAYTRVKLQGALAHFGLAEWAIPAEDAGQDGLARRFEVLWRRRHELTRVMGERLPRLEAHAASRWSSMAALLDGSKPEGGERGVDLADLAPALVLALDREYRAAAEPMQKADAVSRRLRPPAAMSLPPEVTPSRHAHVKESSMIDPQRWSDYLRDGYLELGCVLQPSEVEALCARADDLALGNIRNPEVEMQLDTGGDYEALPGAVRSFDDGTLRYRKIQGLQTDALYSRLLRQPLFSEIAARHYGAHAPVSLFRAMVMNKPAGQGTYLPWHQDGGDVWKLDRDPLVTIWVALDPATRANGCLEVVPGTHQLGLLTFQGSTLEPADVERHCPPESVRALEVPAGHALLLHNWLIHRSGVNPSSVPRRAFTACFMDGRTISTLTCNRFPMVFGTDGPHLDLPFLTGLKTSRDEAERYAVSLEEANRLAPKTLAAFARQALRRRLGGVKRRLLRS